MSERIGAKDAESVADAVRRNVKPGPEQHWYVGPDSGERCDLCDLPDTNPVHHCSDVPI